MLCLNCRHLSISETICDNCGSPLPKRTPPPYQSAPSEDLRTWANAYYSGTISQTEFIDRLESRATCYRRVLQDLISCDISDDMKQEMSEELQIGRLGLEGMLQAVEGMKNWCYQGDQYSHDQALALAISSTRMLNKAVLLNWQSFNTIQESAEQFLEQMGYEGP